ncbi:MAG: Hsp20/alpha crystallin family protein [Desulfotomaculaceae bacterium]|nr:Hsp20/alpha crystallin family protein [Desulfotomaculaceae bacterium]
MDLIRREPYHALSGIQSSINRLFEDNFPYLNLNAPMNLFSQGASFPVDIKDTREAVLIKADLPGMNKEDIKISLADNVLTIRGERKKEEKEEGTDYVRVERSYGSFSRSFTVDVPVKEEEMRARYNGGILEITLPKEKASRRKVTNIDIQ